VAQKPYCFEPLEQQDVTRLLNHVCFSGLNSIVHGHCHFQLALSLSKGNMPCFPLVLSLSKSQHEWGDGTMYISELIIEMPT
jgi:hypothetical protein